MAPYINNYLLSTSLAAQMALFLVAPDNQVVVPAVMLISGGWDEIQTEGELELEFVYMHT